MQKWAQAKARITEEAGRKSEAMSFGTNYQQREFYYCKDKRERKIEKEARNNYESSDESSVDPDSGTGELLSDDEDNIRIKRDQMMIV